MKTLLLLFLLLPLSAWADDTAYNHLITSAHVYSSPDNSCAAVVVSGKEGWKGNVTGIAQRIFKEKNCTVIGIDLNAYLQDIDAKDILCPCPDFTRIALYVEKMRGLKKFTQPILVAYHEGSAFAYLAMEQYPDPFAGLVTFGFCPDLSEFHRLCKLKRADYKRLDGGGMTLFANALSHPFFVIEDGFRGKCSIASARDYLKSVPSASVQPAGKDWISVFQQAIDQIAKQSRRPATVLSDLPLIEYPSNVGNTIIIILCGDGGWLDLGRDLAEYYSSQKYAVLGFDTLQYFWQKREPEASAADMARIISSYLAVWKKQKVLLIGYSYGADVLPFLLHHMPDAVRKQVRGSVLIGPATKTEFEFNVAELQRESGPPEGELVAPQLKKMQEVPVLCIGGDLENDSLCRRIQKSAANFKQVEVDMVKAGHMFGDTGEIIEKIRRKFLQ